MARDRHADVGRLVKRRKLTAGQKAFIRRHGSRWRHPSIGSKRGLREWQRMADRWYGATGATSPAISKERIVAQHAMPQKERTDAAA